VFPVVEEWSWVVAPGTSLEIATESHPAHRCDAAGVDRVAQRSDLPDVFQDPNRTAAALAAWLGEPLLGREAWGTGWRYDFGHGFAYHGHYHGDAFDGYTAGGVPGLAPLALPADRAGMEEFARDFVEALGLPSDVGVLAAARVVVPQEGLAPRPEVALYTTVQGQRVQELLRADVADGGATHFRVTPVVAFPGQAPLTDPAALQGRLEEVADCAAPVPEATMRDWSPLGLMQQGGRLVWVSWQDGSGPGTCEPYKRRVTFDAVTGRPDVSGGRLEGVLCG
jgi:hypothetical protein